MRLPATTNVRYCFTIVFELSKVIHGQVSQMVKQGVTSNISVTIHNRDAVALTINLLFKIGKSCCLVVCRGRSRRIDICQRVSCRVIPRVRRPNCTYGRLISGAGRRHACGEGQGLQSLACCKCSAKPNGLYTIADDFE